MKANVGLSYDVSLYHPQINDVADLTGAFPDARIVFNHVGGLLRNGVYRRPQMLAREKPVAQNRFR
jgi:L-fuconolactonase